MDRIKALAIEKLFKGKIFEGYTILNLIDNGKSAAVFKAEKDNTLFAVKIFDNDLVERFGHEIQNKRIEQEISFKNHGIKNLVKIHDGGNTVIDGQQYYYIVMEHIAGANLKTFIQHNSLDEEFIKYVLKTLLETTNQLLQEKNIAHRDIKPENIMVTDLKQIVLMDLGVLKLIGAKSFSDTEEKQFVGTLRYAAPEFLLRTESDTPKGWKAVNIYQIGATMHDLIMRQELFADKNPFSNLVIAIKDDLPKISNASLSFDLQQMVRNMLCKDWQTRLSLCKDEEILKVCTAQSSQNDFEKSIEAIFKVTSENHAKFDEIEKLRRTGQEIRQKQTDTSNKISATIEEVLKKFQSKGVFNEYRKSGTFRLHEDFYNNKPDKISNVLYELRGDLKKGFPRSLFLLIRTETDQANAVTINMVGIFPFSVHANIVDVTSPTDFLKNVLKSLNPYNQDNLRLDLLTIFQGVPEFDITFSDFIAGKMGQFLHTCLASVDKFVQEDIAWEKQSADPTKTSYSRITSGRKSLLISKIG